MDEPRSGRVVSVNVNEGGVPKLPVAEQWVGSLGLADDRHVEPVPMHGGVDQAVCLYSMEAIGRLVAEGHNAFPGAFGENLTLEGIELDSIGPGDQLAIGESGLVIEISWHAQPCQKQAQWFSDGRFARISGKTHPAEARWYARVISEGPVRPGDGVAVSAVPGTLAKPDLDYGDPDSNDRGHDQQPDDELPKADITQQ